MSTAQKWAHLAAWWALYGDRYNVAALARRVSCPKYALSSLLRDPAASKYAATAPLLRTLTAELAEGYTPSAPLPAAPTP